MSKYVEITESVEVEACISVGAKCEKCGKRLDISSGRFDNILIVKPHDCNPRRSRAFSDYLSDKALVIRRFKPINTVEEFADFIAQEQDYFENVMCTNRETEGEDDHE